LSSISFLFFPGSLVTVGNIVYVLLFGWWISLFYFLVSLLMFCTIAGIPYGMSGFICHSFLLIVHFSWILTLYSHLNLFSHMLW